MALLSVVKGSAAESVHQVFSTAKPTIIGREIDIEVPLGDGRASRRHAAIRMNRGRWILQDLKSSNGTLINGKRINAVQLPDGVQFQIGASVLTFRAHEDTPLEGEYHGVRSVETIREEGGVFVCRARQQAMDRELRLDHLHPRRASDAAAVLEQAIEEAGRLMHPGFQAVVYGQVDGHSETGESGTFVILRSIVKPTLEEKLPSILELSPQDRVQLFRNLVDMVLERATWEHLRYPVSLRHLQVEANVLELSMPALDLGAFIADQTGDTCHFESTAPYLPPECQPAQREKAGEIPPLATAMYNCGCIGYHLLLGQPPMGAASISTILENHRELRPAPASLVDGNCPDALSRLLERMLEKDPAQRPAGRKEVLEVLERAAGQWEGTGSIIPMGGAAPAHDAVESAPSPAGSAGGNVRTPESASVAPRPAAEPVAPASRPPPPKQRPRENVQTKAASSGLVFLPLWIVVWASLFFAAMYVSKEVFRQMADT